MEWINYSIRILCQIQCLIKRHWTFIIVLISNSSHFNQLIMRHRFADRRERVWKCAIFKMALLAIRRRMIKCNNKWVIARVDVDCLNRLLDLKNISMRSISSPIINRLHLAHKASSSRLRPIKEGLHSHQITASWMTKNRKSRRKTKNLTKKGSESVQKAQSGKWSTTQGLIQKGLIVAKAANNMT